MIKGLSAENALRALEHFPIDPADRVVHVPEGLIHATFRVECKPRASTGRESARYCLQGLHPNLSTESFLVDYAAVTDHLSAKNFPAPRLIRTREGKAAAVVNETVWRLSTWLDGASFATVDSPDRARAAGKMLGAFHLATEDLAHHFQSPHPLHDTPFHLAAFRSALERASTEREIAEWLKEVKRLEPQVVNGLEGRLLPDDLPLRVVHGDPKISNILFDPETGEAVGLVDLDTCTRHTVLVDLGDAIRSWCAGPEDNPGGFRLDILESMLEGYAASGLHLDEREWELIPRCGPLITCELASRFLRDALEDRYFGWDASRYPSRRHHNLARGRAMVELAAEMEKRAKEVEASVRRIRPRS